MDIRKWIYLVLVAILFIGCSKEEGAGNSAEKNVIADEPTVSFEEILLLVNLKTTDSTYLVVKSIDSVTLFVNTNYWAKISSQPIDISAIDKSVTGNRYETKNKLNYLLVAQQDIVEPDYTTAGDFARYLNAFFELKQGQYACLIESFQVTFNDNTTKKYYPFEYRVFTVEKNTTNTFIGEIELKIY
jgi:hypothetical protein